MLSKRFYPAQGVKQLVWYLTLGYWGISVSEAEKAEEIANNVNSWRLAKPGIFKFIKVEPALEIVQIILQVLKLIREVKD